MTVDQIEIKLPTARVGSERDFAIGDELELVVRVRVKGTNFLDTRDGLVKQHVMTLEAVELRLDESALEEAV